MMPTLSSAKRLCRQWPWSPALLRALVVWLPSAASLMLALTNVCHAQSYWEMTPYRVQVSLAIDPHIVSGSHLQTDLSAAIVERIDNFVGASWDASVQLATGTQRQHMLTRFDAIGTEDLGEVPDGVDKLYLLSLAVTPGGYHLRAREYDVRTQIWGSISERQVWNRELIRNAAFDVLWDAFFPLAQVEMDAERNVVLRPRAAGLPLRDAQLGRLQEGDLYRPVIRKIDPKNPGTAETQALPWTFLVVEKVAGMSAQCKLHSGLSKSLGKRRGQSEQLALAVRPVGTSTRLVVVGRGNPPEPLAGYDVYAQVPGKKDVEFVGRTDSHGEVAVSADGNPIRVLYVKGGNLVLARLPMVPGLEPIATAQVADDDVRLSLEGYLVSMADKVIDVVARREILMARIRNRMQVGKIEEAEAFFEQLRLLPMRSELALAITDERNRNVSSDSAVQSKMDKLVADSQTMLRRFIDPRPVDKLRSDLNQATKASAPPASATNAATPPAAPAAGRL